MLPLPLSVFITQIVSFLGVAAAAKLAVLTAYYLKDLDIRLMYQENIFRHLGFYKDYDTSENRKGLVAWISLLTLLLGFLPTFLSFGADTMDAGHVTYINIQTSLDRGYDLGVSFEDREDQPLFTEFYDTSNRTPANSTGILLQNYLTSRNKETQINPSGVWYNPRPLHFSPAEQTRMWKTNDGYPMNFQTVNDTGIFSTRDEDSESHAISYRTQSRGKGSYAISYNNKEATEGSSTLKSCAGNNPLESNLVTNMTSIDGHQVQGVRDMNRTCYPITDPSLWLISFQDTDNDEDDDKGVDSLLNTNEDLYFRPASLIPQSSASYSMGVVARNRRKLGMTVSMVKKSAHITIFYSDSNRSLTPDSCNSSSYSNTSAFNQDINMIACELISQAKQNPTFSILQATRRSYTESKMINSVYTYVKKDNGHGIMIDLTLYSALFSARRSPSPPAPEMLVAYQQVKKNDFDTADFKQLLQSINPFPDLDTEYGLNTITDLVFIGAGLFGLYSNRDFLKTTARIIPFVQVSAVWIAVILSLAVIFILIITASHAMTPMAYKTDLRSLLIHTLLTQESSVSSSNDTAVHCDENTGLLTGAVHLKAGELLSMGGKPIILSENIPMMDDFA